MATNPLSELEKILEDCIYQYRCTMPKTTFEDEKKIFNKATSILRQLLHSKVPEKIEETETEKGSKVLYSYNKAIDKFHKVIDQL